MSKRARKRRARKSKAANHGRKPNAGAPAAAPPAARPLLGPGPRSCRPAADRDRDDLRPQRRARVLSSAARRGWS